MYNYFKENKIVKYFWLLSFIDNGTGHYEGGATGHQDRWFQIVSEHF